MPSRPDGFRRLIELRVLCALVFRALVIGCSLLGVALEPGLASWPGVASLAGGLKGAS